MTLGVSETASTRTKIVKHEGMQNDGERREEQDKEQKKQYD